MVKNVGEVQTLNSFPLNADLLLLCVPTCQKKNTNSTMSGEEGTGNNKTKREYRLWEERRQHVKQREEWTLSKFLA